MGKIKAKEVPIDLKDYFTVSDKSDRVVCKTRVNRNDGEDGLTSCNVDLTAHKSVMIRHLKTRHPEAHAVFVKMTEKKQSNKKLTPYGFFTSNSSKSINKEVTGLQINIPTTSQSTDPTYEHNQQENDKDNTVASSTTTERPINTDCGDKNSSNIVPSQSQTTLDHFIIRNKITIDLSYKDLETACVELTTVNGRPFSLLNNSGFRRLMDPILKAFPDKPNITSSNIGDKIHENAEMIRSQIKQMLHNNLINLKLDAVTLLNRKFLGLNGQKIINAKIQQVCLGLLECNVSMTGVNLTEIINSNLAQYDISLEQLYTFTSDNGSNMIKAGNLLDRRVYDLLSGDIDENDLDGNTEPVAANLETVEESDDDNDSDDDDDVDDENEVASEVEDEELTDINNTSTIPQLINGRNENERTFIDEAIVEMITAKPELGECVNIINCVAHTKQLAVEDTLKKKLKKNGRIRKKVRRCVKKCRTPTFLIILKRLGLKRPKRDIAPRWNTTFDMFQSLLQLKDFCIQRENEYDELFLTDADWIEVEQVVECLKPSMIASKGFQLDQLIIGDMYQYWYTCYVTLQQMDLELAKELVKNMEKRGKSIFQNPVICAGLYLDPRFQCILDAGQTKLAINHLVSLAQRVHTLKSKQLSERLVAAESTDDVQIQEQLTEVVNDNQALGEDNTPADNTPSDNNTPAALFAKYIEEQREKNKHLQNEKLAAANLISNFKCIIENYTPEKKYPADTNVLQYWHNRRFEMPLLYELSCIVLAAASTQVDVERLFSGLKIVVSPQRFNLRGDKIDDIMVIRTNYIFFLDCLDGLIKNDKK